MKPATARKILLRHHWTITDTALPPEDKHIVLGAPHSSIWDFAVAWLYIRSLGGKPRVMIKQEFFFWPLGSLLRSLGAIPVDRKNAVGVIHEIRAHLPFVIPKIRGIEDDEGSALLRVEAVKRRAFVILAREIRFIGALFEHIAVHGDVMLGVRRAYDRSGGKLAQLLKDIVPVLFDKRSA